jgi:DNA-nicking Smr family endonuclease
VIDWTDRPPAASYDLHGQRVLEAVKNAEGFLRSQAGARPGAVVRLVTGRGKSGGGAPIRTRTASLLKRLKQQGTLVRDYTLEGGEGSFLVRLRP